jgi:hypothetical protein
MARRLLILWALIVSALVPQQLGAEESWAELRPADGRISVRFPSPPAREENAVPAPPGGKVVTLIARHDGGVYLTGWVDYGPDFNFDDQAEMAANRDNFVRVFEGTVQATKPIQIGRFSGIEFTAAKADEWHIIGRVYIVGRRPYQLTVVVPPGQAASPDIPRFFNSFKLLPN